jgi:hypothetical protein
MTPEKLRLQQDRERVAYWKRWGSYVRDRQWGTVREDYSREGSAWNYFPHDRVRSRLYHWGWEYPLFAAWDLGFDCITFATILQMLDFTWWVNRKDMAGNNVFQGGFLGLDHIGIFDRSAKLPTGGYLEYFHGDNGAGIGTSNQTGWTGLVASMLFQNAECRAQEEQSENL